MKIGELIEQFCRQNGMSKQRFAQACGLSKGYISMLIKNRNPSTGAPIAPTGETYYKISRAMNLSLDALFNIIDDTPVYIGSAKGKKPSVSAAKADDSHSIINPDSDAAAIKAAETLLKHKVSAAPIFPLHILTSMPNVMVICFTEFADQTGLDRSNHADMFGANSQDAMTIIKETNGIPSYYVAYNSRLPFSMLQVAFARELGRIVLGHNLEQHDAVQTAEAMIFARHLLCPRPFIRLMQEKNVRLTVELLGNLTGCYGRALAGIRQTAGANVPADLNARVKKQFEVYASVILNRLVAFPKDDDSPLAAFGAFMDNYDD